MPFDGSLLLSKQFFSCLTPDVLNVRTVSSEEESLPQYICYASSDFNESLGGVYGNLSFLFSVGDNFRAMKPGFVTFIKSGSINNYK